VGIRLPAPWVSVLPLHTVSWSMLRSTPVKPHGYDMCCTAGKEYCTLSATTLFFFNTRDQVMKQHAYSFPAHGFVRALICVRKVPCEMHKLCLRRDFPRGDRDRALGHGGVPGALASLPTRTSVTAFRYVPRLCLEVISNHTRILEHQHLQEEVPVSMVCPRLGITLRG
jgi:hypothetical protein